MEALIIHGKADIPSITLDKESGEFEFSGKSMPEDVEEFFAPILNWIDQYVENPNPTTRIIFKMKYFNTASSKILLDIMEHFDKLANTEADVEIEWHYLDIDEDMFEAGEGYDELIDIPFRFIKYSK